ncbi:NAD(P)H-dependent flavin oxidoreductase [Rubrivivax rivuli]|uniref:Propionate 3-nitronate monooxygenase n=1 Tax=Rubrivivax rivuli TaxID=1862385 RepID=A0A437RK33_9BURK|nr:nitronate monooxygenase [Rubrivivax rivuli]RVU47108.1 nitronate monooxygenase [Rubrivivax rivuli]
MPARHPALARAQAFAGRYGLQAPVLMAPMAGASPVALARAVAQAGGMGALGALLMDPVAITDWVARFRESGGGPLQINLWVPDPPPRRDAAHEAALREFLGRHGPPVPATAGDVPLHDFHAQCQALLAARPMAVSSIMGLLPPAFVAQLKAAGTAWFATVTTVAEARAAEAAGADVIVAQGAEAGGHCGAFRAEAARDEAVGLFALLPQVVDAVRLPVVATGGVADARGVAAALLLGASAVQPGTALLRTPEAAVNPAWAEGLAGAAPEGTRLTRAFSGRGGRALATGYVQAAAAPGVPEPAPYPVQRGLTAAMREAAAAAGDLQHLQAWAGQAAALAPARPAGDVVRGLWAGACELLG